MTFASIEDNSRNFMIAHCEPTLLLLCSIYGQSDVIQWWHSVIGFFSSIIYLIPLSANHDSHKRVKPVLSQQTRQVSWLLIPCSTTSPRDHQSWFLTWTSTASTHFVYQKHIKSSINRNLHWCLQMLFNTGDIKYNYALSWRYSIVSRYFAGYECDTTCTKRLIEYQMDCVSVNVYFRRCIAIRHID